MFPLALHLRHQHDRLKRQEQELSHSQPPHVVCGQWVVAFPFCHEEPPKHLACHLMPGGRPTDGKTPGI